jgi:hypothetical protein
VLARALRIAAISLAVLAVAALAFYSYTSTRTPPAMVGVIAARGSASIEATDQLGAADRIVVSRVTAPGDSWIVAYLAGPGGIPGERIGAALVGRGAHSDVAVPLSAHVPMAQKVVVVLQADRGVRGRLEFDPARFDASPDKPYYVDGAEVRAALTKDVRVATLEPTGLTGGTTGMIVAPGAAALEIAGRITVLERLVVDRVLAPGPAWVAVYLVGDDGAPTERIGQVMVPAGESLGVIVPIDPQQALTEKLLVALHADLGVSGTFEFDPAHPEQGADKPYVVDGIELSSPVLVRGYGMGSGSMTGGGMGAPMPGTP